NVKDCSPLHSLPLHHGHPGDEQLTWLSDLLKQMREKQSKVIIIGHVPPQAIDNKPYYLANCYAKFVHLSGEFSDVILSQYYGHVNRYGDSRARLRSVRPFEDWGSSCHLLPHREVVHFVTTKRPLAARKHTNPVKETSYQLVSVTPETFKDVSLKTHII